MTSRTHDLIAFSSLVTLAAFYPPGSLNTYTLFACVVGNVVGSLIPDMDQAGNRLWDLLPGGNATGRYLRRIFYKHRTITHSLLGVFLIYKGLQFILPKLFNPNFVDPNLLTISIMIGLILHLVADSFTEEGIPLLFPFKLTFGIPPVRPWRIKTGGWFENLVIFPGIILYLFWFVGTHNDKLLNLFRLIN